MSRQPGRLSASGFVGTFVSDFRSDLSRRSWKRFGQFGLFIFSLRVVFVICLCLTQSNRPLNDATIRLSVKHGNRQIVQLTDNEPHAQDSLSCQFAMMIHFGENPSKFSLCLLISSISSFVLLKTNVRYCSIEHHCFRFSFSKYVH